MAGLGWKIRRLLGAGWTRRPYRLTYWLGYTKVLDGAARGALHPAYDLPASALDLLRWLVDLDSQRPLQEAPPPARDILVGMTEPTWPYVALMALNTVQTIALAYLAAGRLKDRNGAK